MKSLINASFFACDEIVEGQETASTSFNDYKATYKMNYYYLHTFLLITIMLSIIISICYCCVKDWLKQKKNILR